MDLTCLSDATSSVVVYSVEHIGNLIMESNYFGVGNTQFFLLAIKDDNVRLLRTIMEKIESLSRTEEAFQQYKQYLEEHLGIMVDDSNVDDERQHLQWYFDSYEHRERQIETIFGYALEHGATKIVLDLLETSYWCDVEYLLCAHDRTPNSQLEIMVLNNHRLLDGFASADYLDMFPSWLSAYRSC